MTQKPYKYAVLKYRPSYVLDERVNIGLLFLLPEDGRVEFLFPAQLQRLNHLYPGTDLRLIRQYLRDFRTQARIISKRNLFVEATRERLLEEEFLIPDANALFFSPWKTGFYRDPAPLLEKCRRDYFSVYEDPADAKRHDEKWLNRSLHDLLKRDRQKELFFLPNRQLTTHRATATFDFAWQNGSFNLVKTLGFDLQHPESILNKSNLWFGKLTQLGAEIEQQQAKVDFLIAPPQSNNPALRDAFAGAVEVLSNIKVPHSLYYADRLLQYADHALQTVQAPPQNIFSLPSKD